MRSDDVAQVSSDRLQAPGSSSCRVDPRQPVNLWGFGAAGYSNSEGTFLKRGGALKMGSRTSYRDESTVEAFSNEALNTELLARWDVQLILLQEIENLEQERAALVQKKV
jgi:hypothetical protein